MQSALKQAVNNAILAYEANLYCTAKEKIYKRVGKSIPMACGGGDWEYTKSEAEKLQERKADMSQARALEIIQLYNWIEDDSLSDVAFQQCLQKHVVNVMDKRPVLWGYKISLFQDSLEKALLEILNMPAFAPDQLRLIQDAKKQVSLSDKPLSNQALQKGLLAERDAQIARLQLESNLLRERNHELFEVNRQMSKTLGVTPANPAEIDAKSLQHAVSIKTSSCVNSPEKVTVTTSSASPEIKSREDTTESVEKPAQQNKAPPGIPVPNGASGTTTTNEATTAEDGDKSENPPEKKEGLDIKPTQTGGTQQKSAPPQSRASSWQRQAKHQVMHHGAMFAVNQSNLPGPVKKTVTTVMTAAGKK